MRIRQAICEVKRVCAHRSCLLAFLFGMQTLKTARVGRLHVAFAIFRTRSSHARTCPILLLVRFTCPVAARKLRAVERSIATRLSLEIRFHLVENRFATLVSSAADFLSRASSVRILRLRRVGLGIKSSVAPIARHQYRARFSHFLRSDFSNSMSPLEIDANKQA